MGKQKSTSSSLNSCRLQRRQLWVFCAYIFLTLGSCNKHAQTPALHRHAHDKKDKACECINNDRVSPIVPNLTQREIDEGWVDLMEAGLDHWNSLGNPRWHYQNGILSCDTDNLPAAYRGRKMLGWIASDAEYRDFILSFEYRIAPHGDSGVIFRSKPTLQPWDDGYEIQIWDFKGHYPKMPTASHGSLFFIKEATYPPGWSLPAPGTWSQVIIKAVGSNIQASFDGHQLLNSDDTTYNVGHLGFQCYNFGSNPEFRKIKLLQFIAPKNCKSDCKWEAQYAKKNQ